MGFIGIMENTMETFIQGLGIRVLGSGIRDEGFGFFGLGCRILGIRV